MNTCEDASFDLFSRPLTEVGLQDFRDEEILPTTAVTASSNTIEFNLSGQGTEYIDMSETRLYVRVKVVTSDGKDVTDNQVSLVKLWPHALFRQCDVYLNGTLVTNASGLYQYLAYISSELSFPSTVKENQLKVLEHSAGWDVKAAQPRAEGLVRLHLPLCNQPRLIPNGVRLHLRLMRTPDDFVINKKAGDGTFKVELEKVSLFVRRVIPTPSLLLEHANIMSKTNCVYPIVRIFPKFHTLQKGVREFDLANVCQGQLPSRVIVGFVKTSAFSGSQAEDPFKFQHFKLDHISLQSNGRSFPTVPITAEFDKNLFARAYESLIDTIQGPCADSESLGITADEYKDNLCLFGFTLAKALNGSQSVLPPRESGYINAKVRFADVLSDNVNAIFFLEFDNFIELDSARNAYIDFAA